VTDEGVPLGGVVVEEGDNLVLPLRVLLQGGAESRAMSASPEDHRALRPRRLLCGVSAVAIQAVTPGMEETQEDPDAPDEDDAEEPEDEEHPGLDHPRPVQEKLDDGQGHGTHRSGPDDSPHRLQAREPPGVAVEPVEVEGDDVEESGDEEGRDMLGQVAAERRGG